ncbi:MAG: hypothetical protein SynsKO_12040 [Synoicihabitans sp.]
MSLLKKSNRDPVTSVLEVGSSHVAAARFRRTTTAVHLEAFAFREVVESDGAAVETLSNETADAIREVAATLDRKQAVTLVIPGHLALIKTIRVPTAAEAQRDNLIAFEARQNIPFPLEEVVWSSQVRSEIEGEWDVLLVAAKIDGVRDVVRAVTATGLSVDRVVPASICPLDTPLLSRDPELVVSIGARSTHLLFRAGDSRQVRTLSLAGQSVTRSIAKTLGQSFAEAEQLKRGVLSGKVDLPAETPAAQAVKAAVDSFAARLQLEISRSLVTQVRQSGAPTPSQLRLAGGGSMAPSLAEQLDQKWRGTVSAFDAFAGVDVAAELRAQIDEAGAKRLSDLVCIATAADTGMSAINLAPPELGRAKAARERRPRWWAAAAIFVAALAVPGLHFSQLTTARENAARDLSQRMVPVQQLADQNQRNLRELERLQDEAAILADRVAARDAWSHLLIDLQKSLTAVGDVWLERLEVLPPVESARRFDPANQSEPGPPQRVPVKLRLSGRLLDRDNPLSRVSPAAYERVTALLSRFVESPRIVEIEGERFDASEPGLLRFDFTLVINPSIPL